MFKVCLGALYLLGGSSVPQCHISAALFWRSSEFGHSFGASIAPPPPLIARLEGAVDAHESLGNIAGPTPVSAHYQNSLPRRCCPHAEAQ